MARRLALYEQKQLMVFGATTYRQNAKMLASGDLDPWVTRMKNMPAIVVSSTLKAPLDWPDATIKSGNAVDISLGSRRTPRYHCVPTGAYH